MTVDGYDRNMKKRAESMKTVAMVIRGSDGDTLMSSSDRARETKKKKPLNWTQEL